jgi:hypothetical protein
MNEKVIELLDQIRCGLIDVETALEQRFIYFPNWEYRHVIVSGAEITNILNEFGAGGWELISIFETPSRISYDTFFKRQKGISQ